MRNYTQFFDDPDEEDEFNLRHMQQFAGLSGGPEARPQLSEQEFLFEDQPDPDYERAAGVLEAPAQPGPSPRALEDDAIRAVRDSYGKKRGFFEDAAPAAIAMGIDALLNKGRGIGAIAGGYGQGVMQRDMRDKDSMRQLAELEITRARETANDAYRQQQYELGKGNLEARNAEIAEMRARRLKEGAGLNRLQESEANLNEARALDTYANMGTKGQMTEAQREANADRDDARQIHKDEIAARNADRDEARRMRLTITNQQNFDKYKTARETREKEDRLATESFNEKSKATRDLARTVQGMEATMSKYGTDDKGNEIKDADIPGVGNVESGWLGQFDRKWVPDAFHRDTARREDAIKMDEARRQANQTYKVIKTGLAAPLAEAEDIAMANGFAEGASEAQFRAGMKVLSDVTKRELRARASASPVNARKALAAEGLADWVGGWGPDSEDKPYPEFVPISVEPERDNLGGGTLSGPVSNYKGMQPPPPDAPIGNTGQRRSQIPRVDDYLRKLQEDDDDIGVSYRGGM